MYIVHVSIEIKEEFIEAFKAATIENSQSSLLEDGVCRFDVLQQTEEPGRFLLCEYYRTPGDQLKHRETGHFKKWKAVTAEMLQKPYTFVKYGNLSPE